jgi:hypothetical protein
MDHITEGIIDFLLCVGTKNRFGLRRSVLGGPVRLVSIRSQQDISRLRERLARAAMTRKACPPQKLHPVGFGRWRWVSAEFGAGRRRRKRFSRPARAATGLVIVAGRWCSNAHLGATGDADKHRSHAQAAMPYSWWSPPRIGRLHRALACTGRAGGSQRAPAGACMRSPR